MAVGTGAGREHDRGDERAVVDPLGAVRGVTGLRVVDASIVPTVTSAAPNLTLIMMAERIAGVLAGRP